ncbi:MAG: class I SAM-dependent methyltransferase [Deltaproteobacteria bacterium]|nr:class I SAM-dependent methyltransferase [Deltaproteobacteria bacterium]
MQVGLHNAQNRADWLQKTLQKIPAGSRILDAGAGERKYEKFCSHLRYVAQDFGRYDGLGNGSGLQTGKWDQSRLDIISDITAIPEPEAAFDAVMCIEVLEHLPRPIDAIREFSRLLKPQGYLIVTAPFCSLTHFAPYHFCTGFNQPFYETHLASNGFEIVEINKNGNFFEFLGQEVRRISTVQSRYTPLKKGLLDRFAVHLILRFLERCSLSDAGSAELLCFGLHVLAQKKDGVYHS